MSKVTLQTRAVGGTQVRDEEFTHYRNVSGTLIPVPKSATHDDLVAMAELTVEYFNRTLRPGEEPRLVHGIIVDAGEQKPAEIYEEFDYTVPGVDVSMHDEGSFN